MKLMCSCSICEVTKLLHTKFEKRKHKELNKKKPDIHDVYQANYDALTKETRS